MKYKINVVDDVLGIDETFQCREGESVLHALHRTGRKGIPVGCRGGGCGVCTVQVKQGNYNARAMSACHISEQDKAENTVLACCIYPAEDLEIQITGKIRRRFQKKVNPLFKNC